MFFQESENVELKEIVVDAVKKEVIAFANSDGGTIYIGVRDDGEIVGVEDIDAATVQVTNMVRDAVKPDVTMFVHYHSVEENGKNILAVEVQRGTDRPYYLAHKGLRAGGVYVRQGSSSVPATDNAIRKMIKETDGDSFEAMRSLRQDLTFQRTQEEFALRGIAFGDAQMQTLKIVNSDGIYTNLGLLLSEQCAHTIKAAVFEGADQGIFKDRREFGGSLLKQLSDVYDYIDLHNQVHATFHKLLRVDKRDYPEVAVREALLNVLVHREYAFSASAIINMYSDKMEFISIGGLPAGIELQDIMLGLSVCRNQNLANVFYRLGLIEAYGTGIRKIMNAYWEAAQKPQIDSTSNAFRIILPKVRGAELPTTKLVKDEKTDAVLAFVAGKGQVKRADVESAFGLGMSTVSRLLRKMVAEGLLMQQGKGKNTRYVASK